MKGMDCLTCGLEDQTPPNGNEISSRPNYDNTKYLNDLLAFVELLRPKVFARRAVDIPADRESERLSLLAMFSEICADGLAAARRGAGLGLEKIVRKHKLDEIETQILAMLAFAAIHGDDELCKAGNIGKAIQFLNQLDPVTAMTYWRKDSRLIAKNIVTPIYPYRGRMTVPDALFLEAAILDQILGKKVRKSVPASRCLPAALSEKLGAYVVGQDQARRTIATGVYKHQQLCRLNKAKKGVDRLQRANIFLIGPTGTGKTHLCRTLAQVLNVPFVICDATQYTETGYVGANVEEMLVALSKQAGQKHGALQGGIIFIDEIDKIAQRNVGPSHNSNRDVSGLSVQTELLKLLDGDIVHYQNVDYDVSQILFIAGGAFSGLEDIIKARMKEQHIGFSADREPATCADTQSLKDAGPEDIMAYGFMPEFMGRFASIVALDGLGKRELVDIMTKPRNNLISQYQALFKASGLNLRIPQTALEWVADQALRNRTGARGLKSILETYLSPILYEQSCAVYGRGVKAPLKEVAFDPGGFID